MEEKVKKSITLDSDVVEEIERIGKTESRKFSNMVNKILKDYINHWKNTQQDKEN